MREWRWRRGSSAFGLWEVLRAKWPHPLGHWAEAVDGDGMGWDGMGMGDGGPGTWYP